jgi:hypothetical protein
VTHEGGLLGLFNPFALRCGLVSVAMLVLHGGVWLACKSEGALAARARAASAVAGIALIVLFAADGAAAGLLPGYAVQSFAGTEAASNPLAKVVVREAGELLDNYARHPLDDADPGTRLARHRRCSGDDAATPRRSLLHMQLALNRRRDCHFRREPVPVPAVVIVGSSARASHVHSPRLTRCGWRPLRARGFPRPHPRDQGASGRLIASTRTLS